MEEPKNGKFILGILGATLGAFIGTIPWILVYVYANYIIAILSVIIAICSYYGYKITKAKIDKKLPFVIAISSILAITVSTFIISPLIMLSKEGLDASFENLQYLYTYKDISQAIMSDYFISLIFTVLGIGGIIKNLYVQIKDGVSEENIQLNLSNKTQQVTPEKMEIVKNVFEKNDALSKNNGLTQEDVLQDLYTQIPETEAKEIFNTLCYQGIIRKSSGKFYFSEKAEKNSLNGNRKVIIITIVVVLISLMIVAVVIGTMDEKSSNKTSKTNNSKYSYVPDTDSLEKTSEDIKKALDGVENAKNSINNTKNTTDEKNEYEFSSVNMKFTAKDDLVIMTENEIEEYLGEEFLDYDLVAMDLDGTRLLYAYVIDKGTYYSKIKDYTAEELLKSVIENSEDMKIESKKISGFDFAKVSESYKENGKKYVEEFYICKVDEKFVIFDYSYEDGQKTNFEKMIQKT